MSKGEEGKGGKGERDAERRTFALEEVRVADGENGAGPVIEGYAAVFNAPSEDLGGFREVIHPGAFKKTIGEADVRALINHDPSMVIGRSKTGTLEMKEDIHGLRVKIHPPDTSFARDLVESLKRGDIDQMSFGFNTVRDEWDNVQGAITRHLFEVRLFDVSAVTYPAYPQTTVQVRSKVTEMQQSGNATPHEDVHLAEREQKRQQELARLALRARIAEED